MKISVLATRVHRLKGVIAATALFTLIGNFAPATLFPSNISVGPRAAIAAAKKKAPAKKSTPKAAPKTAFSLDKFIAAHRANNRAAVHEQLVAAKSNWRRTFTIDGTSGVNLLMLACLHAADYEAMDAIYTLMNNCPDLINARDSEGQTALLYSLANEFTEPFEALLNDKRTNVNIASKVGILPIQMVAVWGARYNYAKAEQAIWEMIGRGASLVAGTNDLPSAINIMINYNAQHLVNTFLPVAQQQLAASQRR